MTAKIIPINQPTDPGLGKDSFLHMKRSLDSAQVDIKSRIRMAKILAPILCDQSSNQEHLATIASLSPLQDKVTAIIMLGFPENRQMLPVLRELLSASDEALRTAAIIAICQMKTGQNNEILQGILFSAYQMESSLSVKRQLKKALKHMDKKQTNLLYSQSGPISSSENSTTVTLIV